MMANETVSFTLRLPLDLHSRMLDVIAATGNEVTRSGLCIQGIRQLLAQLEVCPTMIEGYNPLLDKSARHSKRQGGKKANRKTSDEDAAK